MKKIWWFLHFVTFWKALKNGPFWALSEYLTKKYEEKQPYFDSPYLPCGRFKFYETRQTLSINIWIIIINWKTRGVTFLCWIMKGYWKRVETEKICHFCTIFRGYTTILGHFVFQVWNLTQISFIVKKVFLDIELLPNMA